MLLQFREEGREGEREEIFANFCYFFFWGDAISVTVSNDSQETQLSPQFRGSGGAHLFFELFATKNTSYLIRSAVACIRSATASRKKLKSTNEHRQSRKGSIAQLFVTKSQTAQAQMSTLAYARLD